MIIIAIQMIERLVSSQAGGMDYNQKEGISPQLAAKSGKIGR